MILKKHIIRLPLILLLVLLTAQTGEALQFRNHYSPWNGKRALRKETRFIVLHTTEAPAKGSLEKLYRYGEAHYLVDTDGLVFRIIDRRKVAMHAGRSMWEGLTNLDDYSIGVEVVGYHNKDITNAQTIALRELLDQLKAIYRIQDQNVLTHSMVAYGVPNRWHKRSHRGRKRCGMLFARRSVREQLGLLRQPLSDPDVKAGRLVNADPYLAMALYGNVQDQVKAEAHYSSDDAFVIARGRSAWDIARGQYNSADTVYRFPDGTDMRGDQIKNWKALLPGTHVLLSTAQRENETEGPLTIGPDSGTVTDLAGDEALAATTIYFLKDGRVRQGSEMTLSQIDALPPDTRLLVGYVHGGYVTPKRSAFEICGAKWNEPATVYRYSDGRIISGDKVKEGAVPPMTMIFFQR